MTVEEDLFLPTNSFILPEPRLHYPAKIPVRHWQLRSLITSPSADVIYYASDSDIYRINTRTRRQDLIATLPFEPRCVAAGHGWLCAGGVDNGQFATMRIDDDDDAALEKLGRYHAEVDALLSLDLGPELQRQTQRFVASPPARHGHGSPRDGSSHRLHTYQLGRMIVNSVTLHRSRGQDDDETVAVLTNNDKTVRVFSLTHDRPLDKLDFPFAMNHASISPVGDRLVAVGDDSVVYWFRRVGGTGTSGRWGVRTDVPLPPTHELHMFTEGCSATAFSPSGHLCAVSSQDGIITIFAPDRVEEDEEEAIVKIMPSSRARTEPGSIRSMCFAPNPWDLLFCTEQSGRICVMDVRNAFATRQVVLLSTAPDRVERVDMSEDVSVEDSIDPRLRTGPEPEFVRQYRQSLAAQDDAAAATFAADYAEASTERRRLQRQAREESPQPFTERERQILDALRTSRERMEARERLAQAHVPASTPVTGQPPVSINYLRSTVSPLPHRRESPLSWGSSNPPAVPSLREYIRNADRDRDRDRDRTRTRTYDARRHGVVDPSPSALASTSAVRDLPDPTAGMVPPAQLPVPTSDGASDPWQTIEAAMRSGPLNRWTREREEGMEASFQRRQEIYTRLEQRRRERLRGLYAEVEGMGGYGTSALISPDGEAGLGTAGCAVSGDGRKLYIGVEDGILEFHVNIHGRKCFPANAPR
ncbi:MAG: hypothetical protein M1838_001115 [Thelocarpon superellum]|nr:MAG: hypothetical protein M1838_001115 [Thelocarpon superellum]